MSSWLVKVKSAIHDVADKEVDLLDAEACYIQDQICFVLLESGIHITDTPIFSFTPTGRDEIIVELRISCELPDDWTDERSKDLRSSLKELTSR